MPQIRHALMAPFVLVVISEIVALDELSFGSSNVSMLFVTVVLVVVKRRRHIVRQMWPIAKWFVREPSVLRKDHDDVSSDSRIWRANTTLLEDFYDREMQWCALVARYTIAMALFRLMGFVFMFFHLYLHSIKMIQQGKSTRTKKHVEKPCSLNICRRRADSGREGGQRTSRLDVSTF